MPHNTQAAGAAEREEIEAVIACLGDDAAALRDENPEDERAANMDRAAELLEALASTATAPSAPTDAKSAAGSDGGVEYIHELVDKLERFIDYATGGKLSKSSWALETLKAACDEHFNAQFKAWSKESERDEPSAFNTGDKLLDALLSETFWMGQGPNNHDTVMAWSGALDAYLAAKSAAPTPSAQDSAAPTLETVRKLMQSLTHADRHGDLWTASTVDERAIVLKVLRAFVDSAAPFPEGCDRGHGWSSRTCERGTDSCVVQHSAAPSSVSAEPVAGWAYEFHDFGDVWARWSILNRPDGGANPPTKHHGSAIRNVRPFYFAPPAPAAAIATSDPEGHRQAIADHEADTLAAAPQAGEPSIWMDAGHLREVLNGNDMPAYCQSEPADRLVPLWLATPSPAVSAEPVALQKVRELAAKYRPPGDGWMSQTDGLMEQIIAALAQPQPGTTQGDA